VPGCSGGIDDYIDKNPFWYKFTCYQSGTLGFLITPNNPDDDYDWQLYDITGRRPEEVFTNRSLVVTGNWAGTFGATGAAAGGVNYIQCSSNPADNLPSFAAMPNITQGRQYLLMVSHFTNTQSGYSLSFGGGTASITDPKDPKLNNATASCDATLLNVTLNKKMKCSSLTTSGSVEFTISPAIATVVSASGIGCNSSFDMEAVSLTLNNPLPPGNYFIHIRNGSDANTLLDNCERMIPVGDSIPLTILPLLPTPMDSLTKPGCAAQTLELVFSKGIRCSSIDPDGRDFSVTGTYPVTVTSASGDCVNGLTNKIYVQLSAPLQTLGNFRINLQAGHDGNSIIDECGQETPVGSSLPFSVKDTVNADFGYRISLGCNYDTVHYSHTQQNGINQWLWNFDNQQFSTAQNPVIIYDVFGMKQTTLIVTNGFCSDTTTRDVFLRNTLVAAFDATGLVCPGDPAVFRDVSIGDIRKWSWDFGNGNTSVVKAPPVQSYPTTRGDYQVPIRLEVENDIGCKDTIVQNITILWNCYIAVPSAFTPNRDGLNDFLYPLNAYKATKLQFSVYNRFGQRVFFTSDWTKKWDGSFKGQPADPGTYVWVLSYTNNETQQKVDQKGYSVLIR
jgi:gliding motility-associated-like protein